VFVIYARRFECVVRFRCLGEIAILQSMIAFIGVKKKTVSRIDKYFNAIVCVGVHPDPISPTLKCHGFQPHFNSSQKPQKVVSCFLLPQFQPLCSGFAQQLFVFQSSFLYRVYKRSDYAWGKSSFSV